MCLTSCGKHCDAENGAINTQESEDCMQPLPAQWATLLRGPVQAWVTRRSDLSAAGPGFRAVKPARRSEQPASQPKLSNEPGLRPAAGRIPPRVCAVVFVVLFTCLMLVIRYCSLFVVICFMSCLWFPVCVCRAPPAARHSRHSRPPPRRRRARAWGAGGGAAQSPC